MLTSLQGGIIQKEWGGLDAHGMFQQGLPCCLILPRLLYSLRFCHHMSYRGMAHRPCLSQAQKFLHLFQRTSQGYGA